MMKVLIGFTTALMLGFACRAAAQSRGDEFHGTSIAPSSPPAQTDPAVCRDPEISKIERETGTVARVFDFRASGTRSGDLGAELEGDGLVQRSALCAGKANAVVMFIAQDKIAGVDQTTNRYFAMTEAEIFAAGNPRQPTRPGGLPTDVELAPLRRADDASLVSVCGTILQQKGNFKDSVSCKSGRVVGFCDQFASSEPQCPAIVAELKREVPDLDGLTYDGSRSVSPCEHSPKSAGCKSITRQKDPMLPSPTPNPPATQLISTAESCLSRKLSYYRPPAIREVDTVTVPRSYGSVLYYSPRVMAAASWDERMFRLETAVAEQVQEQHDREFGVRASDGDPRFRIDQIVGFLYRCLMNEGVIPVPTNKSPDDGRAIYGKFLGPGASDAQKAEFDAGFRGTWIPTSLETGR